MGFGDGAGGWDPGGVARGGTVEGWDCFMGGDVTGGIERAGANRSVRVADDTDEAGPWHFGGSGMIRPSGRPPEVGGQPAQHAKVDSSATSVRI